MSQLTDLTEAEKEIFNGERTTFADIIEAGWHRENSSSGNWYWRHKDGRLFMPFWVLEVQLQAEQLGSSRVRKMMMEAIGINK